MELDKARGLAKALMRQHGLADWEFAFDRAKTRAGACRPSLRRLSLSAPWTRIHDDVQVRDTILHEIAHALVGARHGHDEVWRRKALEIGCSASRCFAAGDDRPPAAWVGTCPAGHAVEQHRRPTRVVTCKGCSDVFDLAHVFTWTRDGQPAPMHPNYVEELDALRAAGDRTIVVRRWGVGTRVQVVADGRFEGLVGEVVKIGRTRYHVRVPTGILTVPFSMVRPVRR